MPLRVITSPSASARVDAAREWLRSLAPAGAVLIVGATRAAADELALSLARERGALFGVTRMAFAELAMKLALPVLARQQLSPGGALGSEAIATRVAFDANAAGELRYFAPVADLPGFPRAATRTLSDLQLAGVDADALTKLDESGRDLAALLERAHDEARRAGTVTRAQLLACAAERVRESPSALGATDVVLLDVAITNAAEEAFLGAILASAPRALATVPAGDRATLDAYARIAPDAGVHDGRTDAGAHDGRTDAGAHDVRNGRSLDRPMTLGPQALARLQTWLFSADTPPAGDVDDSVHVFSAPGEGREAVEIARRVLMEADRGVRFDEMAVLLRAPQTYFGLLEHALDRAGIPAWFHRGTRRPDPAGRALLALLACADEDLSARRFAEYVSLGQVPFDSPATHARSLRAGPFDSRATDQDSLRAGPFDSPATNARSLRAGPEESVQPWSAPSDEILDAIVREADRVDDQQPEDAARAAAARVETARETAGTLRAPWRWEDLIVEAAVIGGIDRWQRRLDGLQHEYARRLSEAESDDPESSRARALRRDAGQLTTLHAFAVPLLEEMASWPTQQTWGEWLTALRALVPKVIAQPVRTLRVLQELGPLDAIGPVRLREVRDVLAPRLTTLSHEPPRRRQGRLFVGTPQAARGMSFRVVFVPGLAERLFPQRIREDALLLDERRMSLSERLPTQAARAVEERLHLTLAIGAARERLYASYPRIEINESRPRVPSFYVLDVMRAIEGTIPAAGGLGRRAYRAGGATLAWPAPRDAAVAIDDFEHDLSTIGALLSAPERTRVKGRARYLYELSPELQRSLTSRWLRWHRRQWETADGLVRVTETTAPALATQRLGARPYSLTALQRFASCPYQFVLAAIYRITPLPTRAPLQRLDPLTRGSLIHDMQAEALRTLQEHRLLPLTADTLSHAHKLLEWAVTKIDKEAHDKLAPAIERVWRDEIAAITKDLKIWFEHLVEEGKEWTPERFELAFGLDDTAGRDAHSTSSPARVDGRFLLRGSIDLIERHRQTRFLRVTDHKTGRNRMTRGQTIVASGRVLQPVIYGLALEALLPEETVYSGRLSFCTSLGSFTQHEIPLMTEARRVGLEALEIIDRSVEQGLLAARPDRDACSFCDFQSVCGREEERRTRHKDPARFADLDALRELP